MGTRVYTVYFRNFPEDSEEGDLKNVFKKYGEITKLFLHHTKSYGMVEYRDIGSCYTAIENLHNKPPMNLFVSIAKNSNAQKNDRRDNYRDRERDSDEISVSSSTRTDSNHHVTNNAMNNEDVYMYVDIYNKTIDELLCDDSGRIYVPLDRVTGVRRIYKKKGNVNTDDYYKNPQNYIIEDLTPSNGLDSCSIDLNQLSMSDSTNSTSHVDRRNRNNFQQNSFQRNKDNAKTHNKKSPNKSEENWSDDKPKPLVTKREVPIPDSLTTPKNFKAKSPESSVKSHEIPQYKLRSSENESFSLKKPDEPKQKLTIPSVKLPRNEFFSVVVTQRIDDNNAWVNSVQYLDKIEYIVEMCKGKEFERITDVEVGDYCLALMQEIWCRVKVLEKNPKILIQVIDLGYKEQINVSYLYKIPPYICDIPALAVLIETNDGSPPITEETDSLEIKIVNTTPDGYKVVVKGDEPDEKFVKSVEVEKKNFVNKIFSMLEVDVTGYLSSNLFLSDNKFVGSFLPQSHLDDLQKLAQMSFECAEDKSFSPEIGDLVAGEHEEDGWCRGIFLGKKDDKNKIAFIDYGVEGCVEELRAVPDKYMDIPWFSCVCTVSTELAKNIKSLANYYTYDEIENLNFKIKLLKPNGASILVMRQDDVLGEGEVEPWDPTVSLDSEDSTNTDVVTELCSGDRIKLILDYNGYLFTRTKYCEDLLRKVNDLLSKNISTLPSLKSIPKKGQMVAALYEGEWYRAVVSAVNGDTATVLYVDYGNDEEISWKTLKELNKNLKEIPYTALKIKLKGYPGKFTSNALQHLEELQEKKTVLTVNFDGSVEDGVELITKSGASIVDVLMKLDPPSKPVSINSKNSLLQMLSKYQSKPSVENKRNFKVPSKSDKKIMANDFNLQEVPLGKQNIRILELINSNIGLFSFCLNKEDVINEINGQLNDDIQYYVDKLSPFDPSYKPEVGEVILAKTNEVWKRALVSEITEDDFYEVFLIDHGTTPTINIKNVRRISPDLVKIDAIASIALVNELTTDEHHVKQIIEKTLVPGKVLDINIKSKDESEMFNVEIPQLTKEFQRF